MTPLQRAVSCALAASMTLTYAPAAARDPRPPVFCDGKEATLVGTTAIDELTGTPGPDVIVARGGDDVIRGRGGRDTICGGRGFDFAIGGRGVDVLYGGEGDDTLIGGRATDVLLGERDADLLIGGSGADRLDGGPTPAPFLEGLMGGPGNDEIDGGAGLDRALYFNATGPVAVDLGSGSATGADGDDVLTNVEGAFGSRFDDTLLGDDGSNGLAGLDGDDVLRGLGSGTLDEGSDLLFGDAGNDDIDGGAGYDFASYDAGCQPVTVDLATGTASGQGDDSLAGIEGAFGSDCEDVLIGDAGQNAFVPLGGNDSISGAEDADTVLFFFTFGGVNANLRTGVAFGDGSGLDLLKDVEHMRGTPRADLLIGNWKANTLLGSFGGDALVGGNGNDLLDGQDQVDRADGENGDDTCNAEQSSGCEFEAPTAKLAPTTMLPWSDVQDEPSTLRTRR